MKLIVKNIALKVILTVLISFITLVIAHAQYGSQQQLWQTQQMRMGETFIRVAEPGQIVDTISVWGDVTVPGNYIVPRGSNATNILSYARGPARTVTNVTQLDWSQLRIDVMISHFDTTLKTDKKDFYQFKYNEAISTGMRSKTLQNRDVMIVEVKRKPVIVDWLGVVGPLISAITGIVSLYIIFTR